MSHALISKPFEGKVAFITGVSSGIGASAAELFAARGARIAAVARNVERGMATVERVRKAGGTAEFIQADVSDPEQIIAAVRISQEKFGRMDMAFNNAGQTGVVGAFHEQTLEAWNDTIATNLTSVFVSMQEEIKIMLKQGGGAIVNNCSGAGVMGAPGLPHYTAAKHGILGISKVAAKEYGPHNIRINSICPGFIDTVQMNEFLGTDDARAAVSAGIPLGKMGGPETIAKAAAFLCSDEADYISGDTMFVDGAFLCR